MNTLLQSALVIGALSALALQAAGPIGHQQSSNQWRIIAGARGGGLTRYEAARLQARDNAIQRTIRRDTLDGRGLTLRERVKIDALQDSLSRDIARQRRDGHCR
ncbi:MAG: hypothetical protein IPJ98_21345 [Bryobacterales bacterium]|nr:hypothetical protein [Bryobacterales bacterium]